MDLVLQHFTILRKKPGEEMRVGGPEDAMKNDVMLEFLGSVLCVVYRI